MESKYQIKDNSFYLRNTDIPANKINIEDGDTLREIEKELLEEAYILFFDEMDENTLFDELKKENYLKEYEDKPKEEFAKRLAYYQCEFIALHPFYELNGLNK